MRFNENAHTYEQYAAPQRRFAEALAAFAPFPRGTEITELGAGTGFLTNALLVQGASVEATDNSSSMVEMGRKNAPLADWKVRDAFNQIPKAKALASSGLLHWAPDPAAVLRYWHDALPSKGRLLLGVPCDPCLFELRDLMGEGPVHWRDEDQWIKLLERAQFDVRAHGVLESQEIYPSSIDLFRALHGSGVTGSPRISAGTLKSLIKDYDRLHPKSGGVVATWAWLLVDAVAV